MRSAATLARRLLPRIPRPRTLATTAASAVAPPEVFSRPAKRQQRSRASSHPDSSATDYLKDEVARRLVDRILDIKRRYPTIVDVGCGAGHLRKFLDDDITQRLVMTDTSRDLLFRDAAAPSESGIKLERIVLDEETDLMKHFDRNSIDMFVSNLGMHWINDLPGFLIQARHCLKPDGVFMAAMLGGDTLFELRTSLQLAELERRGGVSPRVSPMAESADMSSLLSRAGYALTTVDVDDIIVNYPSMFELVEDLRAMGESNAVVQRPPFLPRDTLIAASAIYKDLHGNSDGTVPATFQVIYLIGWKPDASQPKPKPRGSAQVSLKDVL